MADTSVNGLMGEAKCYVCLTPEQRQLAALGMLKQIVDAGSWGGIACGTADPAADPGVDCRWYIRTDTAQAWYWDDATGTWIQIIA